MPMFRNIRDAVKGSPNKGADYDDLCNTAFELYNAIVDKIQNRTINDGRCFYVETIRANSKSIEIEPHHTYGFEMDEEMDATMLCNYYFPAGHKCNKPRRATMKTFKRANNYAKRCAVDMVLKACHYHIKRV